MQEQKEAAFVARFVSNRAGLPGLSHREQQLVDLVSEAKLNKEIAYELRLAEGTVREYLSRLFRKLGVKNRTALALWARNHRDYQRLS
jgi:two-component system, NarL family, nitrate/nitrite response regulator NarL